MSNDTVLYIMLTFILLVAIIGGYIVTKIDKDRDGGMPSRRLKSSQKEIHMKVNNESILRTLEPDKVWFTSDTHFYHENILKYCSRPFKDIEEMNNELVRRWNETVPPDGVVFHLGDFAFASSREWSEILDRLNGQIYLILGNHDFKQIKQGFMKRFVHVTQQMTIRVGGQAIVLNHNPFLCYGGSHGRVWQLFGHVHSGPLSHQGQDMPRLANLFPTQYDVGVDNNDFRPVSFAEIKQIITEQIAKREEQ